jgi:putative transposase
MLRDFTRKKAGRQVSPGLGLIDSRSVKTSRNGGLERGIDGGKKIKGRKQPVITDTTGLILTVVIHAANIHDSKAAFHVIKKLRGRFPRLSKIIADGGYRGELIEQVKNAFGWILEVVLRPEQTRKFTVLPKRWIVERTFFWFESFRRLSKDYEVDTESSQTMIYLTMIQIMLNRIR